MKKLDTRGGWNRKKRIQKAESLFLDLLWKNKGGVSSLARELGIHKQQLINWRRRGEVPPQYLGKISRALLVDVYLLNYWFCVDFFGMQVSWENIVGDSTLSWEDKEKVKRLPNPKR